MVFKFRQKPAEKLKPGDHICNYGDVVSVVVYGEGSSKITVERNFANGGRYTEEFYFVSTQPLWLKIPVKKKEKDNEMIRVTVERSNTGYAAGAVDFAAFTTGATWGQMVSNMVESVNLYFEASGNSRVVSAADFDFIGPAKKPEGT